MHHTSRVSCLFGLLLLSASPTAGSAQSAVIDMTRQSGPSKFVSGVDRKPVQLGVPAGGDRGDAPEPIVVVLPQTQTGQDDPPVSEKSQDKEASQQRADNQSQPNSPAAGPSSAGNSSQDPSGEQDSDGSPDVGSCDKDCDDD